MSLPQSSTDEGTKDDVPIVIPDVLVGDVDLLFDVLWANYQCVLARIYALTKLIPGGSYRSDADLWGVAKLGRLLKVSHFFGCPAGVNFALGKLSIHPQSNGAERLVTALTNEVHIDRCEPFIRSLIKEPIHTLPPQHIALLSPIFWERLLYHREELRKLRFAAAVPGEYCPSPSCTHRELCNKMWTVLWKKHMSDILLNDNRPLNDIRTMIGKVAKLRDCECLIFCIGNQTHLINEAGIIRVAIDDLKNRLTRGV